jgi:hypothetical protein
MTDALHYVRTNWPHLSIMPRTLRFLCIAFSVLLLIHACLAPFVENGFWFLLPVAIDILLLWLIWAFSRRQSGTLPWLSTYCLVAFFMGMLFHPFSDEYGEWAWVMQIQFVAEAIVCLSLFFALRMQSTKSWFESAGQSGQST